MAPTGSWLSNNFFTLEQLSPMQCKQFRTVVACSCYVYMTYVSNLWRSTIQPLWNELTLVITSFHSSIASTRSQRHVNFIFECLVKFFWPIILGQPAGWLRRFFSHWENFFCFIIFFIVKQKTQKRSQEHGKPCYLPGALPGTCCATAIVRRIAWL